MDTLNENTYNALRLIRSSNVGPITFWQLYQRYGTLPKAIDSLSEISIQFNRPLSLCPKELVDQELKKAKSLGIQIISYFDPTYPPLLKHIPDAPPILYVWGNTEVLSRQMIGVVGARNASLIARKYTEQLSEELGKENYIIASGLARGIDKHAHLGSLKTGTVAVVAGGVDIIYPPEHKELHKLIQNNGCIVSEMPIGLHPGSTHFPRRNRIISGMSQGTLVVEAALKSGSLITARYTLEQNRELFAMPGSPMDPRCHGTNDLIKKGAHLIQSSQDILEILKTSTFMDHLAEPTNILDKGEEPETFTLRAESENSLDLSKLILKDLSYIPIEINILVEQYNVPVAKILSTLLDLELVGLVTRFSNGTIALSEDNHIQNV